jgi:hypothetical protein
MQSNQPERACISCRGKYREPARYVASDATGLMWFECGGHNRMDNLAGVVRVRLQPIGEWFAEAATAKRTR